jgi:hypothetical protein
MGESLGILTFLAEGLRVEEIAARLNHAFGHEMNAIRVQFGDMHAKMFARVAKANGWVAGR